MISNASGCSVLTGEPKTELYIPRLPYRLGHPRNPLAQPVTSFPHTISLLLLQISPRSRFSPTSLKDYLNVQSSRLLVLRYGNNYVYPHPTTLELATFPSRLFVYLFQRYIAVCNKILSVSKNNSYLHATH